jgi:hypothetical protein
MELFQNSDAYLYNLHTASSSEAKRLWRQSIRERWNCECAYCGSKEELTIDHIIPQSKGGIDSTINTVCCCKECNHSKGHSSWETWYSSQVFFSKERYEKIRQWVSPEPSLNLYRYPQRRNNAS